MDLKAKTDARIDEQAANLALLCDMLRKTKTFDISAYEHECGSPACILGHAQHLWRCCPDAVAAKIGVPYRPFAGLCVDWSELVYGGLSSRQITGPMAAKALERLAEEGIAEFRLEDA